jgi:hypothetical protein
MVIGARVPRGYSTVSDSVRIRNNSVYIGFVKENSDAQRMGRLKVFIPELSSNVDNESSWIIVSYASPFAGASNPVDINGSSQTMSGSQTSYGFWAIPPDINNQVLVCFVNGDINRGYWFACIWQQLMNHMVPGIACNLPTTQTAGNNYLPPVVEYNKINQANPDDPLRPPFTPLANGLVTEGLQGDAERGPSSTSARREAPSKVFGMLSPDGNTIHIDDNPENEFIRIRTKSGTQILVDETTGMVYINSKLGNSWLEVSDSGVDVYSLNSVSIRAQQDFNVRADRNIIFDAGNDIYLKSGADINMQSGNDIILGSGNQLVLSSTNNTSLTMGQDLYFSVSGNFNTQAGGNLTEAVGGTIIRSAPEILDNSGSAPNVAQNNAIVPQPKKVPDIDNGQSATLSTIVSVCPTHEPWAGHPHIGVPLTPGEPNTANGPQGNIGATLAQSSTSVATGTGNQKIVQNLLPGCQAGVSSNKPIPTVSYNAIQTASETTGANFGTMMAIANVESSFQPGINCPYSTATGLYQFIPDTYTGLVAQYGSQYNIGADDIDDPNANAIAGGLYINANAKILQNNGIANPTAGDLYLCHMLGGAGGPDLIAAANSNPNEPISALGSKLYGYITNNPGWLNGKVTGNNLGSNPTVGDYYNNLTGYMNSLASQYDTQAGLPAPCDRNGATQTNGSLPGSNSSSSSGSSGSTGASSTGSTLNGMIGPI